MPAKLSSPSKHGNTAEKRYTHRIKNNLKPADLKSTDFKPANFHTFTPEQKRQYQLYTDHLIQSAETVSGLRQKNWLKQHQEFVHQQQLTQKQHEQILANSYKDNPHFREYQQYADQLFRDHELAIKQHEIILENSYDNNPHFREYQQYMDKRFRQLENRYEIAQFNQNLKNLKPPTTPVQPVSVSPEILAETKSRVQREFQSQSYRVQMDQTIDSKLYILEKAQVPLQKAQQAAKPKSIPPKQDRWYYQEKFRADGWNEAELKHVAKYYRDASDYQRGRGNTALADKYLHMHDAAKVELITQKRLVSAADNKAKRAVRVRHATERYQHRQMMKAAKHAINSPLTFADDNDSTAARVVRSKTAKPPRKTKPKKTD